MDSPFHNKMTTQEEINNLMEWARKEAPKWREEKIREILNKNSPTNEEIAFLEAWARLFNNYKLKELMFTKWKIVY